MKKEIFCSLRPAPFIALLFLLVTFFSGKYAAAQTEKQVGIQQIMEAHNALRSEVGVPALTWSDELAEYAQKWANELALKRGCELEHRPTGENDPWKQLYGENIYWGGGSAQGPGIVDAVNKWGEEKIHFDIATKNCKEGEVCGHYTQIVWKNTTKVGCAIATCPDGMVIVVCNYDPSGNWGGETPF